MINLKNHVTPVLAVAIITVFSASGVEAHGHHAEDIPEGKYMSDDPIVRLMNVNMEDLKFNQTVGLRTMGTHLANDACLWRHISNWNGPWCK